ncbi:ArsR/SmtB family transcription factor [Pseudonocardia spirodelae]|uniref:ArsR family transcriptional regulator n=1 Tax=Pseudonocardia spirodelae TaxID=3133431 RepID=A0ABU8T481_9PSEU
MSDDVEARLRALEEAVAGLRAAAGPAAPPSEPDDPLWALTGLEARAPGSVLLTGSVEVAGHGPVRWQYARPAGDLVDGDWDGAAAVLDALAHPARLAILRHVLTGTATTAELLEQPSVGTTGQLHHHLRQLVAAGWLASTRRGHYEIPVARVVPLLVTVLASRR